MNNYRPEDAEVKHGSPSYVEYLVNEINAIPEPGSFVVSIHHGFGRTYYYNSLAAVARALKGKKGLDSQTGLPVPIEVYFSSSSPYSSHGQNDFRLLVLDYGASREDLSSTKVLMMELSAALNR